MDQEMQGESENGDGEEIMDVEGSGLSHDATNNHVVMRTLFQMLPDADLLKWRKVNKDWNDAARCVLNRREQTVAGDAPISFNSRDQIRDFLKMVKGRAGDYNLRFQSFSFDLVQLSDKRIHIFLESMGNEIRDLSLYDSPNAVSNVERRNRILPRIAKILPEVKYLVKLTLSYNISLGTEEERQVFQLPSAFPFLKVLKIEGILDVGLRETLASYIVERAPHLETIELYQLSNLGDLDTGLELVREQIPAMLQIAAKKSPPPSICLRPLVREYFIDTEASLDALSRTGPLFSEVDNVKCLRIHYPRPIGNGLMIKANEFLALQTKSLVDFEVAAVVDDAVATPLNLLRMPKLKRFSLYELECKTVSPIRSFVAGQFPVLQTVRLNEYRAEWRWFPVELVIPTLNCMTLTSYVGNADDETWDTSFPNLALVLVFEANQSISFVQFILAKLTRTKILHLGRTFREMVAGDAPAGNGGKDLWTIYTGGEPNARAKVGPIEPRQGGASLGNMKELMLLHLEITTTLELEAVVHMSRPGQLPKLILEIADHRRFCQTRSATRKTQEMMAALTNYHVIVI